VDFQELKQEEKAQSETQVGPGEGLKGGPIPLYLSSNLRFLFIEGF